MSIGRGIGICIGAGKRIGVRMCISVDIRG